MRRPAPAALRGSHPKCGAKLRTPTFFFQLKNAGNSTQLANLAGRCRRQSGSEAASIQKGPRRCTSYSVMFGSASTSNGEISPRSNLRRATSAIMAALSVQADKGGTVTRIP